MSHPERPIINTDSLAGSLWAQATAVANLGAKTASLALTELKLAVSSTLIAMLVGALLTAMLFLVWAMLLVTGFFFLRTIGFTPLPAMAVLLGLQTMICALLALLIRYLIGQAKFANTRNALQNTLAPSSSINNLIEEPT